MVTFPSQEQIAMQPSRGIRRLVCMTSSRAVGRPSPCSIVGVCFVVAGLLLSGCANVLTGTPAGGNGGGGGGPSSTPYELSSGPDDLLVSIDVAGGFVPIEVTLRNTAEFLLLGDGTAIVPGVVAEIYPGPAIYPLQSATLAQDKIQELFAYADQAGLLGEVIEYGDSSVTITDLPYTSVNLTTGGRTYSHSAYGLGYEEEAGDSLSASEREARERLTGFVDVAKSLVGADSGSYEPASVVAYRLSESVAPPLDDPELQQDPLPWPIATLPPPIAETYFSSCIEVSGPELAQLLAALDEANELTPWIIDNEPPGRMVFRPVLAGDPGCEQ